MNYHDFLKADILCLLHDYGELTADQIEQILGAGSIKVEAALRELVLEKKVKKVGTNKYDAIDEIEVKRLKKSLPTIF